jgi:hypothetical protein
LDKVADETSRNSQRLDTIEGSVQRFAGALEHFLGRIQIDDRLRLVPDNRLLTPAPLAQTRSASPSTSLFLPTDGSTPIFLPTDDESDVGIATPSAQDTRTTPSDLNTDVRMADVGPILTGSAPPVVPIQAPGPPPFPQPPPASTHTVPQPTVNVIPATPQGSQKSNVPTEAPSVPRPRPSPPPPPTEVESIPPPLPTEGESIPPPPRNPRGRSRTPAAALLAVESSRTTRSRSRSKEPT